MTTQTMQEQMWTPWGTPCSAQRDNDGHIIRAISGTGEVPKRNLDQLKENQWETTQNTAS